MPYVHEVHAKMKALADAPTLGNLHPDARAQAIARAGIADIDRMRWLHSAQAVDADGYEWGVFRVKWENGRAVDVQRALADSSDIDALLAGGEQKAGSVPPSAAGAGNAGARNAE